MSYIYLENDAPNKGLNINGYFYPSFKEGEPNDKIEEANDITDYMNENHGNGEIAGAFNKENKQEDVDIYSFTLSERKKVYFEFYNTYISANSITLLDSDQKKVNNYSVYNNYLFATLPKGTYYLKIESEQSNYGDDYIIEVNYEKEILSYKEREKNDSLEKANDITSYLEANDFYGSVEGYLEKDVAEVEEKDVDIYSFTLDNELTEAVIDIPYNLKDSISLLNSAGEKVKYVVSEKYRNLYAKLPAGKYYLNVESTKDNYGDNYEIYLYMYAITPSVNASDVTIHNNIDIDTVTINNLVVGRVYTIYWGSNYYNNYVTFIARNTKETIIVGPLKKDGGLLSIVAYDKKTDNTSDMIKIKYDAEPLGYTDPISDTKVTVKNYVGVNDSITVPNPNDGTVYKVYKDKDKSQLLGELKPENNYTLTVNLGNKAGSIYVTAKKPNYAESQVTEVKYAAESKTKGLTITDVTVKNNYKADDVITLRNLDVGTYYTIYADKGLTDEITRIKAKSKTQSITVEQLGISAGSIYIVAQVGDNDPSDVTKVDYQAEQLPAIAASNVTVTNNNAPTKDKIAFKNLVSGMTYIIYKDASKKSELTRFTADSKTTTRTIDVPQVGDKAGTIYVVVSNTKEGYRDSALTAVKFNGEKLASLTAGNITIANNIGDDKITLKGLTIGNTYTVYADAGLKKKLTYVTASKTSHTLQVKQIGAKAGSVYVVVSKTGYTASKATKVNFKAQPTAALAAKKVTITNKKKGKDTIKLTGLTKGTTYVIYSDAKKTKKLATIKASKTTHSVSVNLNTKGGKVYVTAIAPGYSESAITTVSYKAGK